MLLTLTTTHSPATDLGYLLHKNPQRLHRFELPFGHAWVLFPEASGERCTAVLLVELDTVSLVQGKGSPRRRSRFDYVSDRPYVASSFLSVAIGRVFGSALAGSSRERPELAGTPIDLEAKLDVVGARGGEEFVRGVFEPLGYEVSVTPLTDAYVSIRLRRRCTLQNLLTHLYVLIPVLDDDKHYWIGDEEVDKLLRRGGDWLASHPRRDQIVDRYLKHRAPLRRAALAQLIEAEDEPEAADDPEGRGHAEATLEERVGLHEQRLDAVVDVIRRRKARRVLDLGCGEGKLIARLLKERDIDEVLGLEVSSTTLGIAELRLRVDQMPERQLARLKLVQGSLTYRDARLEGFDAAAVLEVIEHLEPWRLPAFASAVLGHAKPTCVLITTPNADYNALFATLPAGEFRHPDHQFEWTRAEFEDWSNAVASTYGYMVEFDAIGEIDPKLGGPTQMAVFLR
ncbi:MAG TPA: 3' terminal RNA ribose 2'-O-methyltransferase Hen1 [Dehalococcoidia bacterium]|nr:3' terminal RNA ribose 2'-O-methyltransferase Hen1 [Dehalococcoidia bacterium]